MTLPSNFHALIKAAGAIDEDLTAINDEPFTTVIRVEGDLTGGAWSGEVTPTLDAASGTTAFTFGTAAVDGTDTVLTASLTESQVEGLGTAASPDQPLTLAYNIKYTPSGGAKKTYFAGRFIRLGS
jgi:hypothetical protein